ncbi:putative hemolysin [Oecophyllibacter saccharovorans]|uniref:putative hemolysin n=1 Tax=Oecophyllibacter saccharovorans TaxID=2558360 RepID=UPI0011438021|nr:DUF333 domain-containing protein [Oecophyllibacter saccharovorans]QDH15372.1 DUF333 domain-containing protein [Oecophyllibacter saccharovorans]TPW36390.1 DUF333 domain-containing protein [Oecophyllibacter saccharovorans]
MTTGKSEKTVALQNRKSLGKVLGMAVLSAGLLGGLAACNDSSETPKSTTASSAAGSTSATPMIGGHPNPAAAYCAQVGGTPVIRTAQDGSQSGQCRLPDGRMVDEWQLFRQAHANNP